MKAARLEHQFVESVPDSLKPRVLYVSMDYATTVHLCACGCDNQVVLPLHPTGWRLTYDGETVSISPSVGNWSFSCRSHYWIDRSKIRWAGSWTDTQIADSRRRTLIERGAASPSDSPTASNSRSLLRRIWRRLRSAVKFER